MKFLRNTYFKLIRSTLLFCFLFSIVFLGGYWFGYKGYSDNYTGYPSANINRTKPASKQTIDFDLFWKVWDTLENRYYDKKKIVPGKMVYGAISGMVSALGDPYTVFLPPDDNKLVQEDLRGNFDGIGIQIGYIGTQLAVIAPLPKSPAEAAGIEAGDLIIEIKDEKKGIDTDTSRMSIPDAVNIIRGKAGTKVTLVLVREGEVKPLEVEITRQTIDVPSVTLEFLPKESGGIDKTIAHLKVLKFGGETLDEWNEKVTQVLTEPQAKLIVLDLRNNPGGYLQGAVDLSSDFLETGEVVVIEEGSDGHREESKVTRIGKLRSYKTVVLVNKGSASASEILAGALRDNKKIKLVGQSTFGKGTIQEPQQINGGSGLHITISKWLTPNGTWVNDKGLAPDISVENDDDSTNDEQLLKAIEEVNKL